MVASTMQSLRKYFRRSEMNSMWTPEDDELLMRAKAGDRDAVDVLLRKFGPEVRKHVEFQMPPNVSDQVTVDDVMQVTYLDAMQGIANFEPRGGNPMVAWLKRIAMNNLLDALDRVKKHRGNRASSSFRSIEESMSDLIAELEGSITTPSGALTGKEIKKIIEEALNRLPPESPHRLVIKFYDLDGWPVADVVSKLKKQVGDKIVYGTEGAIYMLRKRALNQLRELLGPKSNYFSSGG